MILKFFLLTVLVGLPFVLGVKFLFALFLEYFFRGYQS